MRRESGPRFLSSLGLVFRAAWRNGPTCLLISAAYAVLQGAGNASARSVIELFESPLLRQEGEWFILAALVTGGLVALVTVFVVPSTIGALSLVGSAAVYGDDVDRRGIIRRAIDQAPEAMGATLLVLAVLLAAPLGLGVVASVVAVVVSPEAGFGTLLAGILLVVPMLYVAVRLALAVPVVMREGLGPVDALRRSWELSRGAWWWIFGVVVCVGLGVGILNGVVSFLSFIGPDEIQEFILGALGSAVAGAVSVTLFGVAAGVAYASRAPEDVAGAGAAAAPTPPEGSMV